MIRVLCGAFIVEVLMSTNSLLSVGNRKPDRLITTAVSRIYGLRRGDKQIILIRIKQLLTR